MSASEYELESSIKAQRRSVSYSHSVIQSANISVDMLAIVLAGLLTYLVYPGWNPEKYLQYYSVISLTAIFTVVVFYFAAVYPRDPADILSVRMSKIVLLITFVFMSIVVFAFAFKMSEKFSRAWLFSWYCSATTIAVLFRYQLKWFMRRMALSGRLSRNVAIIGGAEQGAKLLGVLAQKNEPWVRIVGIFDDRTARIDRVDDNHSIAGNVDKLIKLARSRRIDDIIVALPWDAEERTMSVLDRLQVLPVRVRLCPDLVGFNFLKNGYSNCGGVPVLNVHEKPLDGWGYVAKALEDKVLGSILFLLSLPILLVISVLVKMTSKGPVFFHQKRDGFNGKSIEVVKFRSMYVDQLDSDAKVLVKEGDPRVTPLGRFLRRSSLDELPQIINVLRGEMSLVGPRPHAASALAAGRYYQDVVSQYAHRHKVKPGITGLAQIKGWRGCTDTEEKIIKRVEYDIEYIEQWSILLDLKILGMTFSHLVKGDNAH